MKVTITETIKKEIDVPSPCRIGSAYVANVGNDDNTWVWCYADSDRPSIFMAGIAADEAKRAIAIEPSVFNDAWDRTMDKLNKINFDF